MTGKEALGEPVHLCTLQFKPTVALRGVTCYC